MRKEDALNMFDSFVMEYIAYNRSIKQSFFHHHGADGRAVAADALQQWNQIKRKLLADKENAFWHRQALRELQVFMKADFLVGHFHPHSLKTYILAFRDFLSNLRNDLPDDALTHEEAFEAYFKNRWEKADSASIRAYYEQVSGIQADRDREALMRAALYGDSYFPFKSFYF